MPKGESHLFGFYYDGGIFRDGNERKFRFIHDIIDLYRAQGDTALSSIDLEIGKLTILHVVHLYESLRKGQIDNEIFILENLTALMQVSLLKYQMEYSQPHGKKNIATYIRIAIQKQFEIHGQDFNLSELVVDMKYSKDYYNRMHKKYYGSTLLQYKTKLILAEAKKQFRLGELIINTAYQCGFNSLQAFSRFFKRHTGLSPNEYLDKNP